MTHVSESGTLEPKGDGWFEARCMCGFRFGPLPDTETVVDVLMEHAAVAEADEAAARSTT